LGVQGCLIRQQGFLCFRRALRAAQGHGQDN
jgi:hypothetical protein